jgi:hypothetical protein
MKWESLFSLRSALILSGLILSITFLYPLSGDNALYMYMADLLLKGHLPYLGSWDVNYPGIVFLHAIHVALFGSSIFGFHLFDVIAQLAGYVFIYRLTYALSEDRIASTFAVLCFTIYYVGGELQLCGERDAYIALLVVASAYLVTAKERVNVALPGLLCGLAVLMRPTAAAYVGAIALWLLLTSDAKRVRKSVLFAVYGSLPLLLFMLWYWAIGGLDAFFEATYRYNVEVYARVEFSWKGIDYLKHHWPMLLTSPLGLWVAYKRDRRKGLLQVLLVLAAVVSLIPVYRFPYHFHPLFALLFIHGAIGWMWLLHRVSQSAKFSSNRFVIPATLLLLIALTGMTSIRYSRFRNLLSISELSDPIDFIHTSFYPSTQWGMQVQDSLADFLRANTRKEEMVQSLTTPMYVPLCAGVEPASRFTNAFNLCWRSSKTNELVPMQLTWRREYIHDLASKAPKYIVTSADLPDHVFNNGYLPRDLLASFPELGTLLAQKYIPVKQIGGYTIYQLIAEEGTHAPSR